MTTLLLSLGIVTGILTIPLFTLARSGSSMASRGNLMK
jgi:hypothetical protein